MADDFSTRRIFVQIASYRDPECHHTVRDLFEQSAHPERISVGICWQYDPEADQECFATDYPRRDQVRAIQYHIRDAQGAGWARHEAQTLWQGEQYTLQIQAHMRFEKNWDETLIKLLHDLPTEKGILTAWLPGYFPPSRKPPLKGHLPLAVVNRLGDAEDAQIVHLIKRMVPADALKGKLLPTPFWVGNFMFCRSSVIQEVPSDPYIYFWGEEINYSARLFTHGYDIFHLDRLVAYHYWDRIGVKDEAIYRDHQIKRNKLSLMRNQHVLGLKPATDPEALKDIEKYPMGTARTLSEYWQFMGVDLGNHTMSPKARQGAWSMADLPRPRGMDAIWHPRIFVGIASYRDPECQATLKDLFAKALHPDRINVGICLQEDPRDENLSDLVRPNQVRLKRLHARDSKGANWARVEALSLIEGEEYVLQIDSHMRFERGWDEMLIDMLNRCPSDKPVLCTYLPNYEPPDQRDPMGDHILRVRIRKFGTGQDPQLIHITGEFVHRSDERARLYPSPFYVGNFMFTRASTVKEVPIDPHFYFYGDEISYSARLWTHGYDIFQPDRVVLYHYWVRKESLHLHHYRTIRSSASKRSLRRVKHLLGLQETHEADALVDIERYGLGSERALEDLWAFAGMDWHDRTITKDAEEGRWNMAARQSAKKKTDKKAAGKGLPRIFVQIASYRDPDCQYTVKDIFEKAAHPERILVGIVWQTVREEDAICFEVPYPRPDQVRVHEVNAKEGKGVCWARNLTQKLWQGEEFTLQIDSHMRFEPGWDDLLIDMWKDCGGEKAVLTCYPPGFTPPEQLQREWIFGMSAKEFDKHDIFLMKGAPGFRTNQPLPAKPIKGAFASACMLFGPGSIIKDVPYDPHLYFFGEEISLGVRLWTHGYDLYHPNKLVIYHDWDRGKRKTHFSDHRDWGKLNDLSYMRTRHLLGTKRTDNPEALKNLDQYGLGTARSLEEYQEYSGVDFKRKTISEHALKGVFDSEMEVTPPPHKSSQADNQIVIKNKSGKPRIFVQIASYRDPECQWTVKNLFEQASDPDRINVGICWQFDQEKDQDCFQVSTRPDQVRMLPVDWRETEGVCWARHQTQQLWDGEEYTLQIDSHMRFMPGWDEMMIEELNACDSAKPLLTCSPASYTPPNNLQADPKPTIRRVNPFFPDGNIRGKGEAIDRVPEKPLNGAFVAAGFVFARSNIIREVPYDPYLYFDQEEITYAARLYTHGWDVFSARKPMLYHYYNDNSAGSVRPLHWRDLRQEDESRIIFLRERGLKRFNHLTGHTISSDPRITKELATYGLGRARTLSQFEEYTGIDFKRKKASEKALRCLFIKGLEKYRDKPIYVPELDGMPQVKQAGHTNGTAVLQPVERPQPPQAAALPGKALEPGDFVPMFELADTNNQSRNIELLGGRHTTLFFLPAHNPDYLLHFFRSLGQQLAGKRLEMWQVFILGDTVENLLALKEKMKLPHVLSADPGHRIAQSLGLCGPGQAPPPTGFLLSNNLKVVRRYSDLNPAQLAAAVMEDCRSELEKFQAKNRDQRIITEVPPVLVVPDAFTPELCAKCIQAFRTGPTFEGTVGAEDKTAYRPHAKVRTDFVVGGELLAEIDDKLSRSLFPEIRKVFGFEVTNREYYKIGMYSSEKGGFFKQHRDNFDVPLGYRRVAMTLHLNDDYEGGGLRFPEYDDHIYRPAVGSAIIFSCATLHEARPVTKGERFIVVGFMHGKEEEAYRQYYLSSKGQPLKTKDFMPTATREYAELKLSRDFFKDWQDQNIRYDTKADTAQIITQTGKPMTKPSQSKPNVMINTTGKHQPRKVFESKEGIIFDDFLPEDIYERVNHFALTTDYEYINTKGKISRAWHVHDGFPLRSSLNEFYYTPSAEKPKGDYIYPTKTDLDLFIDHLLAIQPQVEQLNGKMDKDWAHVTATAWIYPHGTGLAMHDDGSGVYTGAYVYFLNPTWRVHWGGLLLMVEPEANQIVYDYRNKNDQMDFYKRKWLHANPLDEMLMEHGFAKCIFPKRNRIVFINNEAYHMVTRVNEQSGDNLRMSIAGFYNRKK